MDTRRSTEKSWLADCCVRAHCDYTRILSQRARSWHSEVYDPCERSTPCHRSAKTFGRSAKTFGRSAKTFSHSAIGLAIRRKYPKNCACDLLALTDFNILVNATYIIPESFPETLWVVCYGGGITQERVLCGLVPGPLSEVRLRATLTI